MLSLSTMHENGAEQTPLPEIRNQKVIGNEPVNANQHAREGEMLIVIEPPHRRSRNLKVSFKTDRAIIHFENPIVQSRRSEVETVTESDIVQLRLSEVGIVTESDSVLERTGVHRKNVAGIEKYSDKSNATRSRHLLERYPKHGTNRSPHQQPLHRFFKRPRRFPRHHPTQPRLLWQPHLPLQSLAFLRVRTDFLRSHHHSASMIYLLISSLAKEVFGEKEVPSFLVNVTENRTGNGTKTVTARRIEEKKTVAGMWTWTSE